jgi:hypothetical protein
MLGAAASIPSENRTMTVTENSFEFRDESPKKEVTPFCVGRMAHIRPTTG